MSSSIWRTEKQRQAFYVVLVCALLFGILVLIRLIETGLYGGEI